MTKLYFILIFIVAFCSCRKQPAQTELAVEHLPKVELNLKGKKVLLYGDSMSSDDYVWYKETIEGQTKATAILAGFSGYTTFMLAEDSQLQRIYDNNPDVIICLVGGNDSGKSGTVGTFGAVATEPIVDDTDAANNFHGGYHYLIQAVSHIIRRVDYYYAARDEQRPYLIFCTPLPQKRENSYSEFSNPQNWLRKRNAIVECCNRYNIHCVDLYKLTNWDMDKEPYWTAPTDVVNNKGVYTMDGLHPNEKGYQQIAEIILSQISHR